MKIKVLIEFALSIIISLILIYSLMIYTSFYEFLPWYEPDGMQFILIPFFLTPLLFLIGVISIFLSFRISLLGVFSSISGLILFSFVYFDQSLSGIAFYIGQFVCAILTIISIIIFLIFFKKLIFVFNKRKIK